MGGSETYFILNLREKIDRFVRGFLGFAPSDKSIKNTLACFITLTLCQ
jgi:hypothetical protein